MNPKTLSFLDARATVIRTLTTSAPAPPVETIPLDEAQNRILAQPAQADRNYPPFNRSTRDGFAVHAPISGPQKLIGEAKAGTPFEGKINPTETIEIMTGAPLPEGANAVVMVEHITRHPDQTITTDRPPDPGVNISPAGSEAAQGATIIPKGTRLDYTHIAWLAAIGQSAVTVFKQPIIAILATGDELVPVTETPNPSQIRNSNAHSIAAQVRRAGAIPLILPIARDDQHETSRLIEQGLHADMLLLSGGVSAGRYDFVEPALAALGAEFFFDRVLIQPGQPVVFGRVAVKSSKAKKFFFGLPGNPASTMLTFELFARAAIDLLSGASEAPLPLTLARLTRPFTHKPGLTRFLPAIVSCTEVTPVPWQGSGDVPSMTRANAYLVADPDHTTYAAGDLIPVMMK